MNHSSKSPLGRRRAKRAFIKSRVDNTKDEGNLPSSLRIAARLKNALVQIGARGIIPRRVCTTLINLLGLREV